MAQNPQQNPQVGPWFGIHCARDPTFKVDRRISDLVSVARGSPGVVDATEFAGVCWNRRPVCNQCASYGPDTEPFGNLWTTWESHKCVPCENHFIQFGYYPITPQLQQADHWKWNTYRITYICVRCENENKEAYRRKERERHQNRREKYSGSREEYNRNHKERRARSKANRAGASSTNQVTDVSHSISEADFQTMMSKVSTTLKEKRREYLANSGKKQEAAEAKQDTKAGKKAASQVRNMAPSAEAKKHGNTSSSAAALGWNPDAQKKASRLVDVAQSTAVLRTTAEPLASTKSKELAKSKGLFGILSKSVNTTKKDTTQTKSSGSVVVAKPAKSSQDAATNSTAAKSSKTATAASSGQSKGSQAKVSTSATRTQQRTGSTGTASKATGTLPKTTNAAPRTTIPVPRATNATHSISGASSTTTKSTNSNQRSETSSSSARVVPPCRTATSITAKKVERKKDKVTVAPIAKTTALPVRQEKKEEEEKKKKKRAAAQT